jgi:Subtilase family
MNKSGPAPDRYLLRRAEKLADEATTEVLSVIVRLRDEDLVVERYLAHSADMVRDRMSVRSARDLVAPDLLDSESRAGRRSRNSRNRRGSRSAAAKSLSFTDSSPQQSVRLIKSRALRTLRQRLSGSDVVRSSEKKRGHDEPQFLWSSTSAILNVRRSDLRALIGQVRHVADIYANRTLKLPPFAVANSEPRVVADHKAHTWGIAKSGALACWGAFNSRGFGTRIAILDTGVDASHPDLSGKVAAFAEFDGGGRRVSALRARPYDDGEHGTHVAGIAVGGNASGRWIGMAPDAEIIAALVLKGGKGTDAQILAGMDWAMEQGADVISMSLGGLQMTPDVLDVYTSSIMKAHLQGTSVVVAIGNDGHNTSVAPANDFFAYSVGATDVEDRVAAFSGGRTQVIESSRFIHPTHLPLVYFKPDVTAPGMDVFSAVPSRKRKGQWSTFSGTSMAAPHVAGALALMLSACPNLRRLRGTDRVTQMQKFLTATVRELGEAGQNHRFGFGRIDVLRAIGFAQSYRP